MADKSLPDWQHRPDPAPDPWLFEELECVLCGSAAVVSAAVAIPSAGMKALFGLTPRFDGFMYGLCERCKQTPDALEHVEKVFQFELAAVRAHESAGVQ